MGFNWKAVRECQTPEESFYRLIGEMLHRQASFSDLIELRDFLLKYNPGEDAWTSLGEALHATTRGKDAGFRLWTAWARSNRGGDFDLLEHARRWKTFGVGGSLEEETATGEDRPAFDVFEPGGVNDDEPEEEVEDLHEGTATDLSAGMTGSETLTDVFQVQRRTPENRGRGTRTGDLVRASHSAVLGKSGSALRALLPPDCPETFKAFGRVFDGVTHDQLLQMLRKGVLPALEVDYEGRFIPVLLHPDFAKLAEAMRADTFRILASGEEPGSRSSKKEDPTSR